MEIETLLIGQVYVLPPISTGPYSVTGTILRVTVQAEQPLDSPILRSDNMVRDLRVRFAFVCFVLIWREDALHVFDRDTLLR